MRHSPFALSAATVVVVALSAVSCGDDTAGIEVGEVGRADVVEVVDAPATVVAPAAATLTAAAAGTLAELRVEPGDEVAVGDVLAVIDSPDAERRLAQAGEALAAAQRAEAAGGIEIGDVDSGSLAATQQATDEAAAGAFDRAREAAGHITDDELREAMLAQVELSQSRYAEASRAAMEAVQEVRRGVASLSTAVAATGTAQRLQAEQAYELAAATVDELTLRAPFEGVVQLGGPAGGQPDGSLADLLGMAGDQAGGAAAGAADRLDQLPQAADPPPGVDPTVTPGAPVDAGSPVLTVVDVTALGLIAEVDETDVLLVESEVEGEVELDATPDARYPATVTAVDLLPTPSARGGVAYQVRLSLGPGSFPDRERAPTPRPGMSAVAHLQVREATNTLAVPAAAVLRVDGTDVVWTVRDGQAERTPVTVGVQGQDLLQIRAGLQAGDRIVVRGADRVTAGQQLP